MLVVPATREAEAEESLKSRRRKLQSAKIASLHFSLVTERDSISKKNKNINNKNKINKILVVQFFWGSKVLL